MKKLLKYFSFALITFQLFFSCSKPIEADLVITNVNIIDVKTGDVHSNMDVIIDGETITSIIEHKNNTTYKSENVIDASDKFLIPGLWDMHVHIFDDGSPNPWKMELMMAYGITGVREMYILPNEQVDTVKSWSKSLKERKRFLPRIGAMGTLVDGNPPMFSSSDIVTTKKEAKEFVAKLTTAGVDFVKPYDNLSKEAFDELIIEAQSAGIYVAGHIPKSVSIEYASEAGIKSIEHLLGFNLAYSTQEDSLRINYTTDKFTLQIDMESAYILLNSYDSEKSKRINKVLAKNQTWIVPTFVLLKNWLNGETVKEMEDNSALTYVPSEEYDEWQSIRDFKQYAPSEYQLSLKALYKHQQQLVLQMHQDGVPILAGTDLGVPYTYPGYSLLEELQEMTIAGLSNLDALQTATINPAIYLDKTDVFGTIEIGKYADLVILDANPLIDIENLKSNWGTIINGELFNRTDLDEILKKAKIKE